MVCERTIFKYTVVSHVNTTQCLDRGRELYRTNALIDIPSGIRNSNIPIPTCSLVRSVSNCNNSTAEMSIRISRNSY